MTKQNANQALLVLEANKKDLCVCGGKLKTMSQIPFAADIFYRCHKCGKKFKRTNYIDMRGASYFQLAEM